VTTPDQSPGNDDDIWDTSSDHHHPDIPLSIGGDGLGGIDDGHSQARSRPEIMSDLPSLRRQHMTSGYREGLAIGKAQVMQQGFDSGYPFGVEIGLRTGTVLGVLEGILAAVRKQIAPVSKTASIMITEAHARDKTGQLEFVAKLHEKALRELHISELMKVMDDEKIAALSEGDGLPPAIEATIRKWEVLIQDSLRPSIHGHESHTGSQPSTTNSI
jgi:hypothetical protein